MITRYDLWKAMAGFSVGLWLFKYDWKICLFFAIITGFMYGWSSIFDPKNEPKEDIKLPDNQEQV